MIQNLNQVSFQGFGTVLPERAQSNTPVPKNAVQIRLPQTEAAVYRTKTDTLLTCSGNMCVLSISKDGEEYQHYYLDKSVSIRPGVLFSLNVYKNDVTVSLSAEEAPEKVGIDVGRSMRIDSQLRVAGIYTFFYQEKEQGFLFPGESHPMPELTYVDQGILHSVADGQDWVLQQGDAMIYAPGQWHMQYADIGIAPRFVTISFDLDGGDLSPLYGRKLAVPQEAVTLLQQMLRTQERVDPYSTDMLMAQLTMLLLHLLRQVQSPSGVKLQGTNTVHSENEIIRHAQQYISAHIREKLSVRLIAQQVDVSPSYLTVLFQKNLQISPGEYIRRIKLQESKQMIRENNLNFTEIAAALQYSTVHHFSRQFKEKFGITPTEYARSVR